MSDFLDLLENVRLEDASMNRLFGDAGTSVRRMRRDDPRYQRSLLEAAKLIADVESGRKPMHRLQEAMSTSDFPLLFGDILDRQLLGRYQEWPTAWPKIAKKGSVRDFRTVSRFTVDGAEAVLTKVKQGSEYPEAALADARYQYFVEKYGRRVPFLWETFVNDDLDGLRETPNRLAKAARMTEEKFATTLYAASTGPNATFFASGNKNLVTAGAGAALSVTSLQAAFTLLWSQTDADGNPIYISNVRLVVPPALAVVARNILNATQIWAAAGGGVGTAADQLHSANWMAAEITELIVNPWLPIVTTTGTVGATAWYLFADPNEAGRPAIEIGFLRGHDTPELFVKEPNAMRVGGGPVAAEDGDFDTDGINYKVRHVIGGTLMEPKMAVASPGQ
jgi:hypothetical protein